MLHQREWESPDCCIQVRVPFSVYFIFDVHYVSIDVWHITVGIQDGSSSLYVMGRCAKFA